MNPTERRWRRRLRGHVQLATCLDLRLRSLLSTSGRSVYSRRDRVLLFVPTRRVVAAAIAANAFRARGEPFGNGL